MELQKVTFAGGCFWCMEPPFMDIQGVSSVQVGYTGGSKEFPTYEEVTGGKTGHYEAIQILFDPSKTSFNDLLRIFFFNIDPTDKNGQFVDVGSQYQTAVFYHNDQQKADTLKYIEDLKERRGFSTIATKVLPFVRFYPAEEWHQHFYQKSPEHYKSYKQGSGREDRLCRLWGPQDGCGPCG